jgi:hypothetical protein
LSRSENLSAKILKNPVILSNQTRPFHSAILSILSKNLSQKICVFAITVLYIPTETAPEIDPLKILKKIP